MLGDAGGDPRMSQLQQQRPPSRQENGGLAADPPAERARTEQPGAFPAASARIRARSCSKSSGWNTRFMTSPRACRPLILPRHRRSTGEDVGAQPRSTLPPLRTTPAERPSYRLRLLRAPRARGHRRLRQIVRASKESAPGGDLVLGRFDDPGGALRTMRDSAAGSGTRTAAPSAKVSARSTGTTCPASNDRR